MRLQQHEQGHGGRKSQHNQSVRKILPVDRVHDDGDQFTVSTTYVSIASNIVGERGKPSVAAAAIQFHESSHDSNE